MFITLAEEYRSVFKGVALRYGPSLLSGAAVVRGISFWVLMLRPSTVRLRLLVAGNVIQVGQKTETLQFFSVTLFCVHTL